MRVAVAEEGAFGVLVHDGYPFAVTLERTYDPVRPKIPPGRYNCTRSRYYRGGYDTYEIHVPGHSRILFHRGNVETDSDGCVLVAKKFGRLDGRAAILESTQGFAEFMAALGGASSFTMTVAEA